MSVLCPSVPLSWIVNQTSDLIHFTNILVLHTPPPTCTHNFWYINSPSQSVVLHLYCAGRKVIQSLEMSLSLMKFLFEFQLVPYSTWEALPVLGYILVMMVACWVLIGSIGWSLLGFYQLCSCYQWFLVVDFWFVLSAKDPLTVIVNQDGGQL